MSDDLPTNGTTGHRSTTPTVPPTRAPKRNTPSLTQASPTASIDSPANGVTTTATAVSLRFAIAPTSAPTGWVWYVVVQPAHHRASDYLTRIRPTDTTMSVGVGPATGGSGATDDYTISVALVDASAASRIGGYSDTGLAPDDTRYLDSVTVHRQPHTA